MTRRLIRQPPLWRRRVSTCLTLPTVPFPESMRPLDSAVIQAAQELFLERGFDGVSVGDIAERAEVGRTTFFRHFGDKPDRPRAPPPHEARPRPSNSSAR
jgi:Bacterial regulatory proteins, tetR family